MHQNPMPEDTSLHVQRAKEGDLTSLDWIVRRFSPFLLVQAEVRLGKDLARTYDPEDLVADVWAITLPRLPALSPRDGHHAKVLVKFLSTVLLNRILDVLKSARRRRGLQPQTSETPLRELSSAESGVITRAARSERATVLYKSFQVLSDDDQKLLVYRGIEQRPLKEVAALLQAEPGTVAVRYHRALARLRSLLPAEWELDLAEDAGE